MLAIYPLGYTEWKVGGARMDRKAQKTQRIFTPLQRYSPLFILLVAVGGLWYPRLGLLMIPVMITLAVTGFLRGKYWCGNICPHGSLFDGAVRALSRNGRIPPVLRSPVVVGLAFAWFMVMLGYRLSATLDAWGSMAFADQVGAVFVFNYLAVTIVGTALGLFINPRAWCSFCPMGTFQVLLYRLGRTLRLNRGTDVGPNMPDPSACRDCGLCGRVCPMQLQPHRILDSAGHVADDGCIRCGVCAENCPVGALQMSARGADGASSGDQRRAG